MASNIDTSNINTNYPVAGEDNDTQGFRDNFNEIKKNLDSAETEITDLQNNTAKTNQSSNFFGNRIVNADIDQSTESFYDLGNIDSDETIDFQNGHYQTITVDNDIRLTLDGWPAKDRYAKIRVSLLSTGSTFTIDWTTLIDGNPGIIKKNQGETVNLTDSTVGDSTIAFSFTVGEFPTPFIVDSSTNPTVVEFWTVDGGETVHANLIGRFS